MEQNHNRYALFPVFFIICELILIYLLGYNLMNFFSIHSFLRFIISWSTLIIWIISGAWIFFYGDKITKIPIISRILRSHDEKREFMSIKYEDDTIDDSAGLEEKNIIYYLPVVSMSIMICVLLFCSVVILKSGIIFLFILPIFILTMGVIIYEFRDKLRGDVWFGSGHNKTDTHHPGINRAYPAYLTFV